MKTAATMRRLLAAPLAVVLIAACGGASTSTPITNEELARRRNELVDRAIAPAIEDSTVVAAMRKVPRHRFVPEDQLNDAYENTPLPIGEDQTISQPFIVALMTHLLKLTPQSKVLEIGTGSGYQAAVLAEITPHVYSIEIVEPLARRAAKDLAAAGYGDVHLRIGDGYLGWPEAAPFDGILVTCAPDHVPQPLQDQLAEGGRLVIPVGDNPDDQELVVIEKNKGELIRKEIVPVRFVPMTGKAAEESAKPKSESKGEKNRTRLN
ncbi:MAG TPA: protein-L-isoaspartate(D-aspartate) O-methyltransferase [bacterium]|nr:protein-L-isoaspartate(D-aspartate) O-methyltransferase [bacterium]